ncbi:hypothetical protein EV281_106138 [Rhizobium sp. BK418]|nr:hypothetical protein EV281_106138 [Rhizobium sp. BK418]
MVDMIRLQNTWSLTIPGLRPGKGTMTRDAAAMIVHGNVWVDVEIYGSKGTRRWIDVTVSD